MDFPVTDEEAKSNSDLFCSEINRMGHDIQFRFINGRHLARVCLSGSEDQVVDILTAYYKK